MMEDTHSKSVKENPLNYMEMVNENFKELKHAVDYCSNQVPYLITVIFMALNSALIKEEITPLEFNAKAFEIRDEANRFERRCLCRK